MESSEEIRAATFDLGDDKAPRHDGFPMLFSHKFWDVVGLDVVKLCNDFYDNFANIERINLVNVLLIPKTKAPVSVINYHPISLINSSLKINSQILATRLSRVIDQLVNKSQFSFIKGRYIIHNVVAVEEIIFSQQKMTHSR